MHLQANTWYFFLQANGLRINTCFKIYAKTRCFRPYISRTFVLRSKATPLKNGGKTETL